MSEITRILILAANPLDTQPVLVGKEFDQIKKLLKDSDNKDAFHLDFHFSLSGKELNTTIQSYKPHIIHFSGHGENKGLIFTDDSGEKSHFVTKEALAHLFELCKAHLQVVFLNACYSANETEDIVAQVPFLIGMNAAIGDDAALLFSKGFYKKIFEKKQSEQLDIKTAFKAGKSQIWTDDISRDERLKPVLLMSPFIPQRKQDILICFSEVDKEWTDVFKKSLKDDLEYTLCPNGNLEVQSRSDLKDIQSSAIILLIMSEAFLNEQRENLHSLELVSNRGTHIYVILLEPYKGSAPRELVGLRSRKFYDYDFSEDAFSRLKNDNYKKELKGLVAELEAKLLALKKSTQKIILETPLEKTPPEPPTKPLSKVEVKVEAVETPSPKLPSTPPKIEETVPPSNGENTGTETDKKPFDYKKYGIIGAFGLAGLGSLVSGFGSKLAETPPPAANASAAASAVPEIINNRYQILADGAEVKDLQTNLIWKRCQVGMKWNGNTCTGKAKEFNFDDAQKQAGNGWRLPTIRELSSLIYCSSGKMRDSDDVGDGGAPIKNLCDGDYTSPTINTKAFPNTPVVSYVWSISRNDYLSGDYVWTINFLQGNSDFYGRRYNIFSGVRLVRGGQ